MLNINIYEGIAVVSSNNNVLTKILALIAGVFFTGAVLADNTLEDEIRERIKPVGEVCIAAGPRGTNHTVPLDFGVLYSSDFRCQRLRSTLSVPRFPN